MSAPAPTASTPAAHRPEIDGLRALAALPVILFHAGFSLFSGGHVGVDVFFVISGYLITTIASCRRCSWPSSSAAANFHLVAAHAATQHGGAPAARRRRVRPEQRFCNTIVARRCVVQAAGLLYYADDDHLSLLGARLVVGDLLAALGTH